MWIPGGVGVEQQYGDSPDEYNSGTVKARTDFEDT